MSKNLYVCSKYRVEYKITKVDVSFDKLIEILEYFKEQIPKLHYYISEDEETIEISKKDFEHLIEFEITAAKLKRFVFKDETFLTKRELRDFLSFIYVKRDKKNDFIRIESF